jgi:betaine-aldehyde dehydrogenase
MSTTSTARNLINGTWSDAGSVHESINPSTGAVVGTYVSAGRAEAQAAIVAARSAFDTTDWSRNAAPWISTRVRKG